MNQVSRRRFLKGALLASAAAGNLGRLAPAYAAAGSANERLSVAVIGVRGRGQAHARTFAARPDCQVTCVCDADRDVGQKYAQSLSKKTERTVKFEEDLRRVFDDKSIDVVSIATPNHWHTLSAIWAMQAGKDVYVEKPVSHNISEGRRLVQVARKYNRICQAGTQKRSQPANQEAARYVAAGKLGTVTLAHCYTYRLRKPIGPAGDYPPPPSVNYDLWAGPAPMGPPGRHDFHYDWHWFWNYGNGEIGNNSVHCVDAMRMILGLSGLGRSVLCCGGRVQFADCGETANTQMVFHDFGPLAVIQEIRNLKTSLPKHRGIVYIVGSAGTMIVADSAVTVLDPQGKEAAKFTNAPPKTAKSKAANTVNNLDDSHFGNFIAAVRSRKRDEQAAEILQGHFSAALCHLGNISYRLGKTAAPGEIRERLRTAPAPDRALETFDSVVAHLAENGVDPQRERLTLGPQLTIDSDAERFVGNSAADALLTREYRKPFVVPAADAI